MSIIQGLNKPIIVLMEDDVSSCTDLLFTLCYSSSKECIKHWYKEDVTFGTLDQNGTEYYTITCPLTENETLDMDTGNYILEGKWKDTDGDISCINQIKLKVVERICHETVEES